MRRRRLQLRHLWRGLPLAFAVACVLVPTAAAAVRIQSVDTSSYPEIRVSVVGPLRASAPRIREDGHGVAGLEARNLGRNKSIVLAIDRSESMSGKPLAAAVTAARSFAAAEHSGDHVGVVAFGRTADALTRFSASPSEAEAALSGLAVDTHSGTALYDAIVVAAQRLATNGPGGRAIVVVTDGADVSSTHSLSRRRRGRPRRPCIRLRDRHRRTRASRPARSSGLPGRPAAPTTAPCRRARSGTSTPRCRTSLRGPGRSHTTRPPGPARAFASRQ